MPTTLLLSPQELHRTWQIAHTYGGGFVSALAMAWFKADQGNKARIEAAFPHLIEEYGPGSPFWS